MPSIAETTYNKYLNLIKPVLHGKKLRFAEIAEALNITESKLNRFRMVALYGKHDLVVEKQGRERYYQLASEANNTTALTRKEEPAKQSARRYPLAKKRSYS